MRSLCLVVETTHRPEMDSLWLLPMVKLCPDIHLSLLSPEVRLDETVQATFKGIASLESESLQTDEGLRVREPWPA